MAKFRVEIACDYVSGHLRYGHLEGVVEAETEEEAKQKAVESPYILELVVDDYRVDDYEIDTNTVTAEVIE